MAVRNRTRHTILGEILLTLNSHFRRTLGFLNNGGIPANCALLISPCHGIYTVGLKEPVDIVFLDPGGKVVRLFRNFPPNCFADSSSDAVCAIELPAETLSKSSTGMGDILEFEFD
ncbi:MAG TPA: DUF192 domain-containing protein [Candidatus Krumholzibacterium sp.]|nr:DUF192 domain-containing protein [Candidatus Krumholzibacterium sp.]